MKNFLTPTILTACLVGAFPLSSCVEPYGTYGSVSTYSPGYRVSSLPGSYRTEVIGGVTYYYNNGAYYRPRSGGYVVVDAPRSSRYYDDYRRHHSQYDHHNRDNRHDDRHDWDGRHDGGDRHGWDGRRDGSDRYHGRSGSHRH